MIRLREASHEPVSNRIAALDRLLKQVCGNTFVVAADVGVVAQHGGRVHGEPGQYADSLKV